MTFDWGRPASPMTLGSWEQKRSPLQSPSLPSCAMAPKRSKRVLNAQLRLLKWDFGVITPMIRIGCRAPILVTPGQVWGNQQSPPAHPLPWHVIWCIIDVIFWNNTKESICNECANMCGAGSYINIYRFCNQYRYCLKNIKMYRLWYR
jgi:hypothetical protein